MSEYGLTKEGFVPKRLDKILEEINTSSRSIFGESINLNSSSPDGQFNGVNAASFADIYELCKHVYDAFDPLSAQGVALSRLFSLIRMTRKPATQSTVSCVFSGLDGTIIPIGFQVAVVGTKEIFKTIEAGVINNNAVELKLVSVKFGTVVAESNTLKTIINPINGLISVTNPLNAVVGENEESDVRFRARQKLSTELPSQYLIDSLYARYFALSNVKSVRIYENDSHLPDVTPSNPYGLPPHSFSSIILGGDDLEIAKATLINKTPGVDTIGDVAVNVPLSDGSFKEIRFQRPTQIPIYVTVNTNITGDFPDDGDEQIKKEIIAYAERSFLIGSAIERTRLFTPINTIEGHSVQSLYIGLAPNPVGVVDLPIGLDELGVFITANIVVNVS